VAKARKETKQKTSGELKITDKKTYFEVDWHDFEDLVKKVYGQDYEFVADQECGNDSSHTFSASSKELDEYEAERVKEFKDTGEYNYLAGELFNDLCRQGKIEEGSYIVNVCW